MGFFSFVLWRDSGSSNSIFPWGLDRNLATYPSSTPGADLGEGLALKTWESLQARLVIGVIAGTVGQMSLYI